MSPVSLSFKRLQQRLRRSLCYGSRQMKSLPLPLSELAKNYFDRHCPFDYISLDSATSLSRHGCVDACTFLIAMVYLDRIRTTDRTCFESSVPGELYLSALIIASKYLHDVGQREFIYNDEWAALASISLKLVNEMELNFLDAIHWNTSVNQVEFIQILEKVEVWVARDSLEKRGFFVSLMIPQIAISASMQRNLAKNDRHMLIVTPIVDNMTQQEKSAFSFLHDNFYEWYTPHVQHVFRALFMSNVAITYNILFNRVAV